MDKTIMIAGDKSIFYRITGQGNPVVFLHGFPMDGEIWKEQVAYLENRYRLIIPDLPGSGRSSLVDDLSMESMAETVFAILEKEEIDKTVMIGHSMGGYVALAFAHKYPLLLKGFGLFHSTAYADNAAKKESRKKNIDFIHSDGTLSFLKQSIPTLFSDDFKMQNPEAANHLINTYRDMNPLALEKYQEAMMQRENRTQVLKQFVKPILFIIGKHDNAISFADSLELCHLPSLSYIHILEKSGHMGMLEEFEKTNWILNRYLDDLY